MPEPAELITGISLIGIYLFCILAIFSKLRNRQWPISASVALAVPITQAIYSAIFQFRFLSQTSIAGWIISLLFIVWSLREINREHLNLAQDFRKTISLIRKLPWIFTPISLCIIYTLIQVIFLPQRNIDAMTYHFPRIWLFIQNNTLFLEHFTRYHEVIFPIGSDILFYPFLANHTTAGIGIFSLSCYVSIGAAVYHIARKYTPSPIAGLASLIILSLTEIVLQGASVKNDILMANAAIAGLVVVLNLKSDRSYKNLLLLAGICLFGCSSKTVFIAVLPGLALITFQKLKLWKRSAWLELIHQARLNTKLTLVLLIPFLIISQIWLFTWNIRFYDGWTGPEAFTHRHTQNDGFKGMAANTIRYFIHTLDSGYLTDNIIAPTIGIISPSEARMRFYDHYLLPIFNEAGSERGAFEVNSITHEDYAWFGPMAALILFFSLPYVLIKNTANIMALLPAIGYFLLICFGVSWMIWNGRFMTTFFVLLTPALAISLNAFPKKWLHICLLTYATCSMAATKILDFNRPMIPIGKMHSRGVELSPSSIYDYTIHQGENIWIKTAQGQIPNPGNPQVLLDHIPKHETVAIVGFGYLGHFNFYRARPDIHWQPLNGSLKNGQTVTVDALNAFIQSDLRYCVVVGEFPKSIPYNLARHCKDGYGHVITKLDASNTK